MTVYGHTWRQAIVKVLAAMSLCLVYYLVLVPAAFNLMMFVGIGLVVALVALYYGFRGLMTWIVIAVAPSVVFVVGINMLSWPLWSVAVVIGILALMMFRILEMRGYGSTSNWDNVVSKWDRTFYNAGNPFDRLTERVSRWVDEFFGW